MPTPAASPPLVVAHDHAATPLTTAPFEVDAATLLLATVWRDGAGHATWPSVTNSGLALTWTELARVYEDTPGWINAYVWVYWAYVPSARSGFSVTATVASANQRALDVTAFTDVDPGDPIGAVLTGTAVSDGLTTAALTPAATGSMLYAAIGYGRNTGAYSGTLPTSPDLTYEAFEANAEHMGLAGHKPITNESVTASAQQPPEITLAQWNWALVEAKDAAEPEPEPPAGDAWIRAATSDVLETTQTTFPINLPTTTQPGDVLLLCFTHDNATNIATVPAESGWTQLGRQAQGTTTNLGSSLFWKRATGADAVTVTTSEAQEATYIAVAVADVTADPLVAGGNAGNSLETDFEPVTVPTGDYLSLLFVGIDANPPTDQTITPPAGYTLFTEAEPVGANSSAGTYLVVNETPLRGVAVLDPTNVGYTTSEQSTSFNVALPSGEPTPQQPPPGAVYDLSRWHITIPAEDPGDGDAAQIDQPALDSYSSEFFHLDADDRMVCVAPVQGATTSAASGATRTELREHEHNYDNAEWDPWTTPFRQMTVTTQVDAHNISGGTNPRQEMVISQIHGAGSSPVPLIIAAEYHVPTPRIRVFKNGPGVDNPVVGITPDTLLTIQIRVTNARLQLWVIAGQVADLPLMPTYDWPISDFDDQVGWYFKAGAYNKTTITSGSAGESTAKLTLLELIQPGDPIPPRAVAGTAAVELGAASVAATGTVTAQVVIGSADVLVGAPSVVAGGRRTTPGTGTVELSGMTVTADGTVVPEVVTGSVNVAAHELEVVATGRRVTSGAATVELGALRLAATGAVTAEVVTGTGELLLGPVSVTTFGDRTTHAAAHVAAQPLLVHARAQAAPPTVTGAARVSLDPVSVTAAGTVLAQVVTGSAQIALAGAAITALGARTTTATAAVTLTQLSLVVVAADIELVRGRAVAALAALELAATAIVRRPSEHTRAPFAGQPITVAPISAGEPVQL